MEGVPLDAEMGVSEEPVTKQPKITIGSMYFNCFCSFDFEQCEAWAIFRLRHLSSFGTGSP